MSATTPLFRARVLARLFQGRHRVGSHSVGWLWPALLLTGLLTGDAVAQDEGRLGGRDGERPRAPWGTPDDILSGGPDGATKPAEPPEITSARIAWEDKATDAEALAHLIETFLEHDREDEALQWAVHFAREGGDVQTSRYWIEQLDPLIAESDELLSKTAMRWLELADRCAAANLPLNAMSLLDGAERLGASDVASRDVPAALATAIAERRDELLGTAKSLRRLARYGAVPTKSPERPADISSADDNEPSSRTSSRRRRTPSPARSRQYTVRTDLGTDVARQALAVLDHTHAHCVDVFDDARTKKNVEVEILTRFSTFALRRQAAEPAVPPWTLAWHDVEQHRIVALDPRVMGEPFDNLWGLLAREASRPFLRTLAVPAPPWLEEGLAIDFEGVRLRADGTVDVTQPPWQRLDSVLLSAKGRGTRRASLEELLELRTIEPHAQLWSWALVAYLREARADDGTPLWADRFERLLDDYRHDTEFDIYEEVFDRFNRELPEAEKVFRLRIVIEDEPRDGVTNIIQLEDKWLDWLAHQSAVKAGKPAAVDHELERIARIAEQGDVEVAARRLGRVLRGSPFLPEAHGLMIDIEEQAREQDAAVLAARNYAAVTALPGMSMPSRVAKPSLDEQRREEARFTRLQGLDSRLASDLRAADDALRDDLVRLAQAYRSRGLPLAALRLLDHVLAAAPLDAGFRALRDGIAADIEDDEIVVAKRLPIATEASVFHGDRSLWVPTGEVLQVRCHDRVQPTELRGLRHVLPPYEVELAFSFERAESGHDYDDGSNFAGVTFGAPSAEQPGQWAILLSPVGRIELANQGNLEWPSEQIGRTTPTSMRLVLRVGTDDYEIVANGASLGRRPLGTREPAGWLGLFVRHADVTFTDFVVSRRYGNTEPPRPWWARWER